MNIKTVLSRILKAAKPARSVDRDLQFLRRVHARTWPSVSQFLQVKKILTTSERRIMNLCLVVFAIGIVWLGYGAVKLYRVQIPASGGRYVEAMVGAPQLINPVFSSTNEVDQDIARLVYTGLMRYDKEQHLVPDLAEQYEISEDRKTYTFKLREGILWHDGEPLTARDVAFTIESIQNPGVNSPLRVAFQGVDVRILDDRTIQFVLQEPFSPFLGTLTLGIIPEHLWFDVQPERFRLFKANLEPIGTGPYMVHKFTKNDVGAISRYELVRNEAFYRQRPYIKEIIFQFYPAYESGAIQDLQSQRVDGLSFVPYDLRKKVERKHIELYTPQLPQYTALFFNTEQQPILKDASVKEALVIGLDKIRILREALGGEGQIIHSPILPGFPGYDEAIGAVPYDIQAANALLDEVSTKLAADDFITTARETVVKDVVSAFVSSSPSSTLTVDMVLGELSASSSMAEHSDEFRAVLSQVHDVLEREYRISDTQLFYRRSDAGDLYEINLVTADTREYRQVAQSVAGYWEGLGIKTTITYVSPKDIQRDVLRSRNYDVLLYGIILGGDPDQYPFWHSTQIDYPGLNLSRYVHEDVDALLVEARETDDPARLQELGEQLRDQLAVDRPAIFLYMPTYTYAISDKVKGVELDSIFHPSDRFANLDEWYIKTKGTWK